MQCETFWWSVGFLQGLLTSWLKRCEVWESFLELQWGRVIACSIQHLDGLGSKQSCWSVIMEHVSVTSRLLICFCWWCCTSRRIAGCPGDGSQSTAWGGKAIGIEAVLGLNQGTVTWRLDTGRHSLVCLCMWWHCIMESHWNDDVPFIGCSLRWN